MRNVYRLGFLCVILYIALAQACTPTTCEAEGRNCGCFDDGCGQEICCGSCGDGFTCNKALGQCGCISPETCDGRSCGTVEDKCGNTVECGTCDGGSVCNDKGACECQPFTCEALGRTCGMVHDGCGSFLSCGSCEENTECNVLGVCEAFVKQAEGVKGARSLAAQRRARSLEMDGEAEEDDDTTDVWSVAAANVKAARAMRRERSLAQGDDVTEEEEANVVDPWNAQPPRRARSVEELASARVSHIEASLRQRELAMAGAFRQEHHARSAEEDVQVEAQVEEPVRSGNEADAWASHNARSTLAEGEVDVSRYYRAPHRHFKSARSLADDEIEEGDELDPSDPWTPAERARLARSAPAPAAAWPHAARSVKEHKAARWARALEADGPADDEEDLSDPWSIHRIARSAPAAEEQQQEQQQQEQQEPAAAVQQQQAAVQDVQELSEAQLLELELEAVAADELQKQQKAYKPHVANSSDHPALFAFFAYGLPALGVVGIVVAGALLVHKQQQKKKREGYFNIINSNNNGAPTNDFVKYRRSSKHAISIAPSPQLTSKPNPNNNNNNIYNNNSNPAPAPTPAPVVNLSASTKDLFSRTPKTGARLRMNSPAVQARMSPKVSAASLKASQTFSL